MCLLKYACWNLFANLFWKKILMTVAKQIVENWFEEVNYYNPCNYQTQHIFPTGK
jgi:hypothetical protein